MIIWERLGYCSLGFNSRIAGAAVAVGSLLDGSRFYSFFALWFGDAFCSVFNVNLDILYALSTGLSWSRP